jgi:hypothetical protein
VNATAQAIAPQGAGMSGAVKQALFGRFMLPDMSEHACQVHGITVDGATFLTNEPVSAGLSLVAYLEEVGRIEATSAEPVPGGFRVTFSLTGARRDRFETRLKWLVQKEHGQTAEDRRHTRFEPREKTSQITMPDGREYNCEVVDISLSGAAIKVEVMPSLGTYLLLGKMRGRVVRYLDNGIAIEFVKLLDRSQLGETVR